MAKISSASTAPTGSAPARAMRRTRSQSAEPVATAPEPATTGGRRGRGASNARAGSAQAEAGRKTKAAAPVADLTTVEEDEDNEDDELIDEDAQLQGDILAQSQAAREAAAEQPQESPVLNRHRISTGSAISGTTAKTSFSAEEIEEMDAEIMIDVLPNLAAAADGLANFLAPEGSNTDPARWKDIRSYGTKLAKLYTRRRRPFVSDKEDFGSQEYVRPRNVLRALLDVKDMDEVPEGKWRPDNILLKINLAEMLNTILVVCDTDEWTINSSDALERLHAAFPDAIAGREYSFNTLSFYLDLTAQLTIRRMDASIESEPNFSPHAVVDNLFYDDDGTFRHLEDLGLLDASEDDRNRALELIDQTARGLRKPFKHQNGAGAAAANGKLKAMYRWDALKMHTLKYYEQRAAQLDKRIVAAGGMEQILRLLTQEVERQVNQQQADQIRRKSTNKPESTPRASLAGIAALKRLAEEMSEQESASEKQPTPEEAATPEQEVIPPRRPARDTYVPEPTEPPNPEPTTDEGYADVIEHDFATSSNAQAKAAVQPVSRSELSISEQFRERQLKRQQKSPQRQRKRFIDPQENAVELEWNEDELTQHSRPQPSPRQSTQSRQPESSAKGKRPRAVMEEDDEDEHEDFNPTQDEGFQVDTRDTAAADQRRREVSFAQKSRPAPRYSSVDPAISSAAGPSNYASTAPHPRSSASPNKRQRLNPGSSVVPLTQPAPAGEDLSTKDQYDRAKIYARMHSAVAAPRRAQQQRRPWLKEEEDALMDLIAEHGGDGISYSTLKAIDAGLAEDAKLGYRTAEDLRFKARNMKVTFLMGSLTQDTLPPNWEFVALDKKAIEKLRSRGINYVQERQRGLDY